MRGKSTDGFWLNDPEWEDLRQRVDNTPSRKQHPKAQPRPAQKTPAKVSDVAPTESKKVQVSINVSVPQVRLPKLKLSRMQLRIGIAAVVVIAVGGVGAKVIPGVVNKDKPQVAGATDMPKEPDFKTVLPEGKKDQTKDGRVGYDPKRRVVSFADTLDNTEITVSQQPLPEAFKKDPDAEVKKVAEGFAANEVINESSPKAYLGTSEKGPQSVVFHKNGLLVFIYSTRQVEKSAWAEYITKLQ
ncbi:MAG: hypothetical protein JWL85_712 [Candidatus Saccharibacteria bacterium]|nr:hypothetical protein [Candidatus Saccharibacteria bacterium]